MKIGIICIICEMLTVIGILYAFICKVELQEILAGVMILFLISLAIVRTGGKKAEKEET